MKSPELGRLERVTSLRDVWADEARDFTPWLAKEENIQLLGDTIGLDLEVEAQKDAIEEEFGEALTWRNPERQKLRRIFTRRTADVSNREQWPEYHEWLLENLEKFRHVFGQRVKQLAISDEFEE